MLYWYLRRGTTAAKMVNRMRLDGNCACELNYFLPFSILPELRYRIKTIIGGDLRPLNRLFLDEGMILLSLSLLSLRGHKAIVRDAHVHPPPAYT